MTTYILVYIASFLSAFCYSNSKNRNISFLFKIMTFLILFLPAALRYNVGADYAHYVKYISQAFARGEYDLYESAWIPLLYCMDRNNISLHFFFVVSSFLTLFCFFILTNKRTLFVAVPVYFSFAYLESYCLVRQGVAVAVFLVAIKFYLERKSFLCVIFAFISILFHKSAAVLCLMLFCVSVFNIKFSRWRNVIFFILIFVLLKKLNLAQLLISNIIGLTPYAYYANHLKFSQNTEMGTGLGFLLRAVIIFIILIACSNKKRNCCKILNHKEDVEIHERAYYLVCAFMFFQLAFVIMSTQVYIFNRLPNLLTPFYGFAVSVMAESKFKYRKIALMIVVFFFLIFLVANLRVHTSDKNSGLGITPYQSIFSR